MAAPTEALGLPQPRVHKQQNDSYQPRVHKQQNDSYQPRVGKQQNDGYEPRVGKWGFCSVGGKTADEEIDGDLSRLMDLLLGFGSIHDGLAGTHHRLEHQLAGHPLR